MTSREAKRPLGSDHSCLEGGDGAQTLAVAVKVCEMVRFLSVSEDRQIGFPKDGKWNVEDLRVLSKILFKK